MSRIGKNPITIPSGVTTSVNGQLVEVKGPKGTLSFEVPAPITVAVEDNEIVVSRPDDHRQNRALHGLSRSLVNNLVVGVTEGYTIKMEFSITGIDKQQVGQIAANIRRLRKDDPYKGKGIRYEGEQVRRKVGKTGK